MHQVGDKVRTHLNEQGIIVKPAAPYTSYDWWIKITYTVNGKTYETTEPYRNSELTNDNQNS